MAVTQDATAPAEGPGLSYHRISWSPHGALAFAAVTRSGDSAYGRLYAVESPGGNRHLVAEDPDHFIIYVHWSPRDSRQLAYLIEDVEGVALHLVTMQGDPAAAAGQPPVKDRLLGRGRPLYFSWSPDGQQVAWHAGGPSRDAANAELVVYDIESASDEALPVRSLRPGAFYAPAWSPEGDSWLGIARDGENDQLVHVGHDGASLLAPVPATGTAFSWSPSGQAVAYATRERTEDPYYGPVYILDPDTGSSEQVTDDAFRVVAFFWSPDGGRLAYLTWLDLPQETWTQWRVVDLSTREDRGFAAFKPTPLMRFALHSFDQYAQSHRFWSADGRYLVYADRDALAVDRVWLVDTGADRGADPILVDEGTLAYWSWGPTATFGR